MPYVSKEDIAKKRKALKKALPGFKISVTNRHHTGIMVVFKEGPIRMLSKDATDGYEHVNHFYYREHYADDPKVVKVLDKVMSIIGSDQKEQFYDYDYGSVPNFYISLNIGSWDKPYQAYGCTTVENSEVELNLN